MRAPTLDIDDGKGGLNVVANGAGAGRHDVAGAALILLHMEAQRALLRGQLIDALDIDGTQVLDVDGSALQKSHDTNRC